MYLENFLKLLNYSSYYHYRWSQLSSFSNTQSIYSGFVHDFLKLVGFAFMIKKDFDFLVKMAPLAP